MFRNKISFVREDKFKELSPPVLPMRVSNDIDIRMIQEMAKKSISRHVPQHSITDIQQTLSQSRAMSKLKKIAEVKRTKQPSLPYLQSKRYYDKWYIPYDQRYIRQQRNKDLEYSDENQFYNNIHELHIQYDPFQDEVPTDIQRSLAISQRNDALREILKGHRMIGEFKKSLEKQSQRIPGFVKFLIRDEK